MDIREKLVELFGLAARVCNKTNCDECRYFTEPSGTDPLIVDILIHNGVTVQTERELVCVTKTGPSEAVYFRKVYFCPSCDTAIADEMLDVNTGRVFGSGTVMKDNKVPKCCPECGTRIVMPTPPKGE